ncbi:MAG: Hpt domain-containing protein [Oligoflexales bacterium]|nr:Hpt domain-containing protein [Oligoflexales bacterium]
MHNGIRTGKKFISLDKKLLFLILLVSSLVTTVLTMISFYLDYNEEMNVLEETFSTIEKSNVTPTAKALWEFDHAQITNLVHGILQINDIVVVKVVTASGETVLEQTKEGNTGKYLMKRIFKLELENERKEKSDVGILEVTASKHNLYFRLIKRAAFFFLSQGVKTLLVSFCIVIIIRIFVTRKISFIAKYFEGFDMTSESAHERLHVSSSRNPDEFSLLEGTINEMVDFIQKVNKAKTLLLSEKTRANEAMLKNIKQGVLMIDEDGLIVPEYSDYLEDILERNNLGGLDVVDVLFEHSEFDLDRKSEIKAVINLVVGSERDIVTGDGSRLDASEFRLNSHLLPNKCELHIDHKTKQIEMDWDTIVDGGTVIRLILTMRDVTDLAKLRKESMEHRQELEMIGEILQSSPRDFDCFIRESENYLKRSSDILNSDEEKDMTALDKIFRNLHTVKGNARTYGLKAICEAVHKAEQTYDGMRLMEKVEWNRKQLLEELKEIESCIQSYKSVNEVKLGRSRRYGSDDVIIERPFFDDAYEAFRRIDVTKIDEAQKTLEDLKQFFESAESLTFEEAIGGILKAMPILADELNKQPPCINIDNRKLRLKKEEIETLKVILMHSFRNSIDHGIESPLERKGTGKNPFGTIDIQISVEENNLKIVQRDDGRGLCLPDIKKAAMERNIISPGQKMDSVHDIAKLIFLPGVTTSKTITHISGRGIGMDVIKSYVEEKGGSVDLILESDDPGRIFVPFSLCLIIPRKAHTFAFRRGDESKLAA